MTAIELQEALTALAQPHAEVHLVGSVVCHDEHKDTYNDVKVRLQVTGVRSTHPRVVEIVGEEA